MNILDPYLSAHLPVHFQCSLSIYLFIHLPVCLSARQAKVIDLLMHSPMFFL